jgi:uncharacterized protein (TIGR02246 family)
MGFDEDVRSLYRRLIEGWNSADAAAMTRDFAENANMVGFDGTQVNGRDQITGHLAGVFASHKVAAFVTLVRDVREVAPDVAILCANAGMVPPGKSEINPATNAVQTLVAVKRGGRWWVELFQNTPAAWHGREKDVRALTAELQAALDAR